MIGTRAAIANALGIRVAYASDQTVASPARQAILANAYDALPEYDASAVPAWRALAREVSGQHAALVRAGIRFTVTDSDPYATPRELFADLDENRRVSVFATASTGAHAVFSDSQNDAFRGVHDVLGHYLSGRGFDRHGEEAAYRRHARMFSPLARLALATETRGQNASLNTRGVFAEQRIAILPSAWLARDAVAAGPLELVFERADAARYTRESVAS